MAKDRKKPVEVDAEQAKPKPPIVPLKQIVKHETWEGSPSDLIRRYTSQWGLPEGF